MISPVTVELLSEIARCGAKRIPAYKVGRTWRIAKKDVRWLMG